MKMSGIKVQYVWKKYAFEITMGFGNS